MCTYLNPTVMGARGLALHYRNRRIPRYEHSKVDRHSESEGSYGTESSGCSLPHYPRIFSSNSPQMLKLRVDTVFRQVSRGIAAARLIGTTVCHNKSNGKEWIVQYSTHDGDAHKG